MCASTLHPTPQPCPWEPVPFGLHLDVVKHPVLGSRAPWRAHRCQLSAKDQEYVIMVYISSSPHLTPGSPDDDDVEPELFRRFSMQLKHECMR